MSYTQIAVGAEGQTKHFDCINQVKGCSTIDKLLMVFDFLFGCWHRNLSRPFTLSGWTYEVCLNCGKQFPYNRAEISLGVSKQKDNCSSGIFIAPKPPECSTAIQSASWSRVGSLVSSMRSTAHGLVSLCRKDSRAALSMNLFWFILEFARRSFN